MQSGWLGETEDDKELLGESKQKECNLNLDPLKSHGSLDTRSVHTSSICRSRAGSVCLLNLGAGGKT